MIHFILKSAKKFCSATSTINHKFLKVAFRSWLFQQILTSLSRFEHSHQCQRHFLCIRFIIIIIYISFGQKHDLWIRFNSIITKKKTFSFQFLGIQGKEKEWWWTDRQKITLFQMEFPRTIRSFKKKAEMKYSIYFFFLFNFSLSCSNFFFLHLK